MYNQMLYSWAAHHDFYLAVCWLFLDEVWIIWYQYRTAYSSLYLLFEGHCVPLSEYVCSFCFQARLEYIGRSKMRGTVHLHTMHVQNGTIVPLPHTLGF